MYYDDEWKVVRIMKKRVLFIYNPHAGKAYIKSKLSDIIEILVNAEYKITIYSTKGRGHANQIVIDMGNEMDYIVCSGGDGTLNEITDGVMHCDKRPIVGYIPAGTTNDFAKSLGLPKNLVNAAKTIVNGVEFPYDIGSLNDRFFTYCAAFGVFSDVSYETPQFFKNILGRLAYILEGAKRVTNIKSYHLKVKYLDDENVENYIEDDFIYGMITNSISIAGFKGLTGKHVQLDDGVFEVVFIKMPQNAIELQAIITSLLLREVNQKYMYSFHTNETFIESVEGIPWCIDGEFGGEYTETTIKNHKQAIKFIKDKELPNR